MLKFSNGDVFYGESQVLHDVTVEVPESTCTVLLGRNGAGKTTTLKAIIGELPTKRGEIRYKGEDITRASTFSRSRRGLAYVASDSGIFAKLTVDQNMGLAERGRDKNRSWTRSRVFELLPTLRSLQQRQAGVLSGGERQMLKLGVALLTEPELILLDEPTQGVAPVVVNEIHRWLQDLLSEGMSLLLSEQNARFAAQLGERAYVIEKGAIVAEGPMAEMSAPEIVNRYLAV